MEEQHLEEAAAAPFLAEAETPLPRSWHGWVTIGLDDPKGLFQPEWFWDSELLWLGFGVGHI